MISSLRITSRWSKIWSVTVQAPLTAPLKTNTKQKNKHLRNQRPAKTTAASTYTINKANLHWRPRPRTRGKQKSNGIILGTTDWKAIRLTPISMVASPSVPRRWLKRKTWGCKTKAHFLDKKARIITAQRPKKHPRTTRSTWKKSALAKTGPWEAQSRIESHLCNET